MVVLRRRIKHDVALTAKKRGKKDEGNQLVLALAHDEVLDDAQVWEYTVLVSNAQYGIAAIGQLYRDRCDCESGFDELKNLWGWGGFTTQDMHRSQVTARAVALVYNWWSWYVRAANHAARARGAWVAAAFRFKGPSSPAPHRGWPNALLPPASDRRFALCKPLLSDPKRKSRPPDPLPASGRSSWACPSWRGEAPQGDSSYPLT